MNQQPLISVVLPTFNGARYLAESLDSVLAQTYSHWELIVVDDASTDETPDIIARYTATDARIRCLRHERNQRLPAALNSGFAASHGDYLSWTSDDNRYRPQAFATMARVLCERPMIDFVYADFDIMDASGDFVAHHTAQPPEALLRGETSNACFLYRRAVYEHLGRYAEDLFLAEDYDYWLRVFLGGHNMVALPESLYEYRRHERSLTDAYRGQTFAAAERALLRNLPAISALDSKVRGEVYLFLASLASWRGERRHALAYALRALRYSPGKLGHQAGAYILRRVPVLGRSVAAQ
jgi:glycosyltransferase involved in cell wall biosynthesis